MECNCCNGTGHKFKARGMNCNIIIRGNIMSVYLPNNATDLIVKACPLCGRNIETSSKDKKTV